MRLSTAAFTALSLAVSTLIPGQVAAEAKIYPYHAGANYCPAGLQPVTINGVICCGSPNQHVSYQSMMSHPAPKKHVHKKVVHKVRSARAHCPAGTKGCS